MITKQLFPRAVISDLDGTLIDSAPDVLTAANVVLSPYGITASLDQVLAWLGNGARSFIFKALKANTISLTDAGIDALTAAFSARYQAAPCQKTQPFPGAIDALQSLRQHGVSIAVCTNKPEAIARLVLDKTGLAPYIDVLVGAGPQPLKPAPDGVQSCLTQLGVARTDAVYLGDHWVDLQTARAAGMPVMLAEFGYSQVPVATLGADATFAHWQDVPAQLAVVLCR